MSQSRKQNCKCCKHSRHGKYRTKIQRLAEDILVLILSRLPLADQCRLRCVCRAWERVLRLSSSSYGWHTRPTCILTSTLVGPGLGFFCPLEDKWYRLPLEPHVVPSKWEWERKCKNEEEWELLDWDLADVDGGLVLFVCWVQDQYCYYVGNPLTSSGRAIELFSPDQIGAKFLTPWWHKLIVDQVNKTFKVTMVQDVDNKHWTTIYDSTKNCWTLFGPTRNHLSGLKFCVWKNHVFAYCTDYELAGQAFWVLDTKSGQWTTVEAQLPGGSGCNHYTDHLIYIEAKEDCMLVFDHSMRIRQECLA